MQVYELTGNSVKEYGSGEFSKSKWRKIEYARFPYSFFRISKTASVFLKYFAYSVTPIYSCCNRLFRKWCFWFIRKNTWVYCGEVIEMSKIRNKHVFFWSPSITFSEITQIQYIMLSYTRDTPILFQENSFSHYFQWKTIFRQYF